MMPNQKHIAPVKPRHNSNAVFDDSVMAFTVAGITVASCKKSILNKMITNEMRNNKIQIMLSTMLLIYDEQFTMND
jgi:hypothetical protein